jgi:hypothetical protein
MSLINALRPILRDSSAITLTISVVENATCVLVVPRRVKHDPDTTDVSLATLQAALAQPIRILIPNGEDADQAVCDALLRINEHRSRVQNDLESYLDDLAKAQAEAKAATAAAKQARNKAKSTITSSSNTNAAKPGEPEESPAPPEAEHVPAIADLFGSTN